MGAIALGMVSTAAAADVVIRISKYRQTMYVYVDGYLERMWAVSTGRWGYSTPEGSYRPTSLDASHRSGRYGGAPMPYAIFFHGGYAIHGSYDVDRLGEPASHGCIRLHPRNASELYNLVRDYGPEDTTIIVSY